MTFDIRRALVRLAAPAGSALALLIPMGASASAVTTDHFRPSASAMAATVSSYHFSALPIASAGSIGPSHSVSVVILVRAGRAADPGGTVYLSYTTTAAGDSATVPSSQCGGASRLSSSPLLCLADSKGQIVLMYTAPPVPPGQGTAVFLAANAASHPSVMSADSYDYATNYRFSPSPIARSGSLTAGAMVHLSVSAQTALDAPEPNSPVYLSFVPATGGGTANVVGSPALTSSPTLYRTDSQGLVALTYVAPASVPAAGVDTIVIQDLRQAPQVTNTDSYAFSAKMPVVSVGDASAVEGDVKPGIPAEFTVTIAPVQANPVTFQYTTTCGVGDTACAEDFAPVLTPQTITIAAHTSSAKVAVTIYSYLAAGNGEPYDEGFFVHLSNPRGAVLGRSVGEGTILPDHEAPKIAFAYLYTGDVGLVPTIGANVPVYVTISLGVPQKSAVTFHYATADGSALAGRDYAAASGTMTIPAGQTFAVIPVSLLANTPPVNKLNFTLTISAASGPATIYSATGTGTVLPS
jgi:hypothetical protein